MPIIMMRANIRATIFFIVISFLIGALIRMKWSPGSLSWLDNIHLWRIWIAQYALLRAMIPSRTSIPISLRVAAAKLVLQDHLRHESAHWNQSSFPATDWCISSVQEDYKAYLEGSVRKQNVQFFKRCNIEQKRWFRVYFVSFFLSCILYGLMFTHKNKMNESPQKRTFFVSLPVKYF